MHKPSMGGANKAVGCHCGHFSTVCSHVKLPKKIRVRLTGFCWGVYISVRLREGNRTKTWFYDSSAWQADAPLRGLLAGVSSSTQGLVHLKERKGLRCLLTC